MRTSRTFSIFLFAITAALPLGCNSQPKQSAAPLSSANASKPKDATPAPRPDDGAVEPKFNVPDALARKTAEYSQQVQTEMASAPRGAVNPATGPSQVAAGNPGGASLIAPPQGARTNANQTADLHPRIGANAQQPQPLELGRVPQPNALPPANVESSPATANAANNQIDKAETAANTSAGITPQHQPLSAAGLNVGDAVANSTELGPKISRKVKEYPRDVSGHLDFQLLRFLLDDRVPDQGALVPLPTEDRELLNTVIDGLVNFRSALRQDNNMLLSRKVKPLLEMADRLRSQADLSIPTIALCTKVRTFGEYEPIDPARFAQGSEHEVVLYCEIENFSSQLDEHQLWQTRLTQEAVLYSDQGLPVWSDKNQQINDTARRRRHDFFVVKILKIPANLAVGRYLMKVTVVDQQVNRVAEATVPIVIAVGP